MYMKTITKVIPRRVVRSYQCTKCNTKFHTPKLAETCNAMPVEEKKFKLGDKVRWHEQKYCDKIKKYYPLIGIIAKISGPVVPDFDYNARHLSGKLSGMHVHIYLVAWSCPHCGRKLDRYFYSPELKKI